MGYTEEHHAGTDHRHPTLHRLETLLASIGHRDAAVVHPVGAAAIVLLPTARWAPGLGGHAKGARGLLPHPLQWQTPIVVAMRPGATATFRWSSSAWGRRTSGTTTIACTPTVAVCDPVVDLCRHDSPPTWLAVTPASDDRVRPAWRRIARDGNDAQWQLHEELAAWLARAFDRAHRCVSTELGVSRCLDAEARNAVLADLELGVDGRPGLLAKTIERLSDPTRSRPNVDVGRYLATTFRRDAELAIRRRIDDPPWVGVALRRFSRSHPDLAGQALVEAFNASACLAERIGRARAERALDPRVQPEQVELHSEPTLAMSTGDRLGVVEELACATAELYRPDGGVAAAARLATRRGGRREEKLAALAEVVGGRRELTRLSAMDEGHAAAWVAERLADRASV